MQGDSWDEPTLLPTQGAALDVRAKVSVRLPRALLTRRRCSCCRLRRTRTRQPPASPPSSCTSARTRCVRSGRAQLPCTSLAARQVRAAVTVVLWTPEGRRLLTGSQIGEFTLWNGVRLRPSVASLSCSRAARRHVVQLRDHFAGARHRHSRARVEPQRKLAHLGCAAPPLLAPCCRSPLRLPGDDGGVVKYWQPNMNNVKATQAHKEPVSSGSARCPCRC